MTFDLCCCKVMMIDFGVYRFLNDLQVIEPINHRVIAGVFDTASQYRIYFAKILQSKYFLMKHKNIRMPNFITNYHLELE
jgi:hypothetical protein